MSNSRLRPSDALLWSIEKDPTLRTTIVAILVLDRSPDFQRLRSRLIEVCDAVPRFRQRVVEMPYRLGPPQWQFDQSFDIDYHLRRVVVPAPGDLRALLDVAGPIAGDAFDKDRALWQFTLVDGLANGQSAFIQKVHHSVTDGVGAVQLASLLLDRQRKPKMAAEPSGATQTTNDTLPLVQSLLGDPRSVTSVAIHGRELCQISLSKLRRILLALSRPPGGKCARSAGSWHRSSSRCRR